MDATVDAIEDRLTPGQLVSEVWGLFRGGSNSSLNRIWTIAKQHPMPVTIIGLGLGWMVYESAGGNAAAGRHRPAQDLYSDPYDDDSRGRATLDSARQAASAAARGASDAAGSVVDKVSDMAADARDMAGEVAGSVRRQASELGRQASEFGDQARTGVQQARTGFWDTLEEQPLVVGAATLAAGLLVGLLLPSTAREDELMGQARDSLIAEVKGLGEEAIEKGRRVASAAAETVKRNVEAEGLSARSGPSAGTSSRP
jgi:hypothetical protein